MQSETWIEKGGFRSETCDVISNMVSTVLTMAYASRAISQGLPLVGVCHEARGKHCCAAGLDRRHWFDDMKV